jgi:hypothetical protein
MSTTPISYRWNIWSPGAECTVVEYGGPTGQRTLQGQEKEEALKIIQEDIDAVDNGARYSVSVINEDERWYWWTIQPSGRSRWEVKLDEEGDPLPNPCERQVPPDPRNVSVSLANCSLSLRYQGQQVTMTLKGTAISPTQ